MLHCEEKSIEASIVKYPVRNIQQLLWGRPYFDRAPSNSFLARNRVRASKETHLDSRPALTTSLVISIRLYLLSVGQCLHPSHHTPPFSL
jgi:hypothetical protein